MGRGIAGGVRPAIIGAALFAVCFIALYGRGELGWSSDALDHVSFIRRSVESGALFPRDSFFREGDGTALDPRKGLWHPVLGLVSHASRVRADRLWSAFPSLAAFFALGSFLWFALELCRSKVCASLALLALLIFQGGEGFPWLAKLGFSKNIAQVLLWALLAFLLRFYRSERRAYLWAAAALAAVGAAYHVVFSLLLGTSLLAIFIYVAFSREGRRWRRAFWLSLPLLLAVSAAALAPRLLDLSAGGNPIHTHRQGMLELSEHLRIVDLSELATRQGLVFFYAIFMAPFYFLVVRPSERKVLIFVLFIVPVLIVLNPLTAALVERRIGYLHYRLLDAAPLAVVLASIIEGLAAVIVFGKRARGAPAGSAPGRAARGAVARIFGACALAVFLVYPARTALRNLAAETRGMAARAPEAAPGYDALMKALDERIPDHAVIASDPLTSYLISAYTDHFVTVAIDQHGSPVDTSALERLRGARDLLSPAVPLAASLPWLERMDADYVLFNETLSERSDFFTPFVPSAASLTLEKLGSCPEILRGVFDLHGFHLFEVQRDAMGAGLDSACCAVRAGAQPCGAGEGAGETGIDAGCGLVLSSITLDAYLLHPGDTVRGHFCWSARESLSFGLPLDVVMRIDTPFPKGPLYRSWYGKQYRRFMERRNMRFYRLTWTRRLMSGFSYPDRWEPGRAVRQDFVLVLSPYLAPGDYELRVRVMRTPYLMNRTVSDYLSNDDSLQGVPVSMIHVEAGG